MRKGLAVAALVMTAVVPACNGQFRFAALDGGSVPPRCASDSDCPLTSLHCDPMSGACLECVSDSQCAGDAARRCDLALHVCVQCGTDADCSGGDRCVSKTCIATCTDGGACADQAQRCDSADDLCVTCATSADCIGQAGHPACDIPSGRCVECTGDSMCNRILPRCDPSGTCVRCLESSDCPTPTPVCDPADHTCTST